MDDTIEEITNLIYDTLMKNTQHPQFDINKVENQEVDAKGGIIRFDYENVIVNMQLRG